MAVTWRRYRSIACTLTLLWIKSWEIISSDNGNFLANRLRGTGTFIHAENKNFFGTKTIFFSSTGVGMKIKYLCCLFYFVQALNLMKFLREEHNTYPILPMYNSLLSACAQMESSDYANRCLDLMESQMIGKNDITYLALLKVRNAKIVSTFSYWTRRLIIHSSSDSFSFSFILLGCNI